MNISIIFSLIVIIVIRWLEYENQNGWIRIWEESKALISKRNHTLASNLESFWKDKYTRSAMVYPFIENDIHFIGENIHLNRD